MSDATSFWNWAGRYVGYRLNDELFYFNGRQAGYFAEGDEVYSPNGGYIGEVRSGSRLITNLAKKAWRRTSFVPHALKGSPGHPDLAAKEMLAGHEDFPAPQEPS